MASPPVSASDAKGAQCGRAERRAVEISEVFFQRGAEAGASDDIQAARGVGEAGLFERGSTGENVVAPRRYATAWIDLHHGGAVHGSERVVEDRRPRPARRS